MTFGENLKAIRNKYGIPMSVIGERAGIHRAQMCVYANDNINPRFSTLVKIIKACPVEWEWEIDGFVIKEK